LAGSGPTFTLYSLTDDNCAGTYVIFVTATLDNTAYSQYYEIDLTIYSLCKTATITQNTLPYIYVGYPGTALKYSLNGCSISPAYCNIYTTVTNTNGSPINNEIIQSIGYEN
jgi:hypothetical protein